ncbi:putative F-box/LRR-repeat protein 22 [Lolium rigidum]|uniref:putative F-box/LRR-repeat protein 22 n=1 Tax=Lolium rigidum TaxID=89674 RepID=UPI001F5DE2A1|nr:putative F-box/LRR-repeat protein 22 [Lolium rigidum]
MDGTLPSPAEWRDWAALPSHVLCAILSLIQVDILRGVGVVLACKSWRRVAVEENLLWQRIDLAAPEDTARKGPAGWQLMARAAVDRSAGRCESFRGRADGEFLIYLADRSPSLRSLHVTSWFYMVEKEFITGVIKKLPLLEQLVLSGGMFGKECLEALLEHCPRLQLVDMDGCEASSAIGIRFVERCKRRIKELQMPKMRGGCGCCVHYAQRYADEHDE